MFIERIPNRNSPPAILLREAWREGKKIRKRTLANLTHWPSEKVEALRCLLKNEPMVASKEAFIIERSLPHGHVEAVLGTLKKLGLGELISSTRCRERDLVVAMIAERLIHPCSKLATTRLWHMTTLAEELGVTDADEEDLYEAMDWLLAKQQRIEKKLAARHLSEGSLVLYDVTSSYYEGRCCPLARFGHDRDGKKGRPIIVYGLMTDAEGHPVAVEVYPGGHGRSDYGARSSGEAAEAIWVEPSGFSWRSGDVDADADREAQRVSRARLDFSVTFPCDSRLSGEWAFADVVV
jgi:hypothetical protein